MAAVESGSVVAATASARLVCGSGEEHSILSALRNGWDSVEEEYVHALLRFFEMEEATGLRAVCREMADAVSIAPFPVLRRVIRPSRLDGWRASFPNASVRTLTLEDPALVGKEPESIFESSEVPFGLLRQRTAVELAASLPFLKTLQVLEYNTVKMERDDALALFTALPHVSALQTLSLSQCSIDDAGAIALAAVLPSLTELSELNLAWNGLADEGLIALAAALPSLTKLRALNMSINSIGDIGAIALSAQLHNMEALTLLSLLDNEIGNRGKDALLAAARTGCKLDLSERECVIC